MKVADIEKVKVTANTELMLNTKLHTDAKNLLNYDATHIPVYGELTQVLNKLDIEPLNRLQVERYKEKKTSRSFTNIQRVVFMLLAVQIAAIITCYAAIMNHIRCWDDLCWSLGLGSVFMWVVYSCWQDERQRVQRYVFWERTTIGTYDGFIPPHILQKACEIKHELPSAQITIDRQMTKDTRWYNPKPAPDPFLVAKLGNEEFYIDVWNEPEFERKATL